MKKSILRNEQVSVRACLLALLMASVNPSWGFTDCSVCPEMVNLQSGAFYMGFPDQNDSTTSANTDVQDDEKPQHLVHVRAFALGKFEVTQSQWQSIMGSNPSLNKGALLPVENISWDDAQLYIKELRKRTGMNYRLPSEAEWEFAARAGSTTRYPWGDSDAQIALYGWSKINASSTNIVGSKEPNQFGIYDMIGNVAEWTADCWTSSYLNAPVDGSAWQTGNCSLRVLRGGSWGDDPQNLRTTVRDGTHPTYYRFSSGGFRVARDAQ